MPAEDTEFFIHLNGLRLHSLTRAHSTYCTVDPCLRLERMEHTGTCRFRECLEHPTRIACEETYSQTTRLTPTHVRLPGALSLAWAQEEPMNKSALELNGCWQFARRRDDERPRRMPTSARHRRVRSVLVRAASHVSEYSRSAHQRLLHSPGRTRLARFGCGDDH